MARLKSLFGIFVVAAVVYLIWKMMPPYIQAYQFQEELQSISRNNEYSPLDENAIRGEVKKQIAQLREDAERYVEGHHPAVTTRTEQEELIEKARAAARGEAVPGDEDAEYFLNAFVH